MTVVLLAAGLVVLTTYPVSQFLFLELPFVRSAAIRTLQTGGRDRSCKQWRLKRLENFNQS